MNLRRYDRGQSIVEAALIAPLFLVLALGAVDVGGYMYDGIEVANAAHTSAQYAVQTAQTVGDYAGTRTAGTSDAKQIAITIDPTQGYCACDKSQSTTFPCGQNAVPCPRPDSLDTFVKVIATGTFKPIIALPGLPAQIIISKTAIQQVSPT
ncbi:MAG: hypothetical protein NVS3B17_17560 [Vulcanimicrobiaceae bacterium]